MVLRLNRSDNGRSMIENRIFISRGISLLGYGNRIPGTPNASAEKHYSIFLPVLLALPTYMFYCLCSPASDYILVV